MQNPFYCGDVVPPDKFVGRKSEFRRIVDQVKKGASTLVVGDPQVGKTSFLRWLSCRKQDYGEIAPRLFFQYIDLLSVDEEEFGFSEFWQQAITPLYEKVFIAKPDSHVSQMYNTCLETSFDAPALEGFVEELSDSGWRLVLLLDEFDVVLDLPKLNTSYFLGKFRSLTSFYEAVSPVMAARKSGRELNAATESHNSGSPYFNYLSEVVLGPLHDKDCATLLAAAGERFTSADRRRLVTLTGGHPYLLQVAASELWWAYIDFPEDANRRWKQVIDRFYRSAASTFDDMWRLWSPEMRMAFTSAVLPQITSYPRFNNQNLLRSLDSFPDQLGELEARGLIFADKESESQWSIRSQVALWFLANKLAEAVCEDISYEEWLHREHIEGSVITSEQWNEVWAAVKEAFKDGTKAFAEGFGKGLGGGLGGGIVP